MSIKKKKINLRIKKALTEYIRILKKKYSKEILDVKLFGSVAKGNYDDESDVDILVLVKKNNWKFKNDIVMSSYEPELKYLVVISPLVMHKSEYDWYKRYKDPLYNQIEKYGIDLWKKI
ncbi:MAG: nucleotidyltransferase domain-containing protein [bacterium]